jgi:hypothetical protein
MLTNTQIRALSRDHLTRVVHNMDPRDAISLLIEHLVADYDTDQDAILQDVLDHYGDVEDAKSYLIEFGFDPVIVDQLLD